MDLVRDRSTLVLSGKHDRWVTGALALDMLPLPRQRSELEWQRAQLTAQQLEWLAGLRTHTRGEVELWHGSAEDPVTGWISNQSDAAAHLALQQASIGLVGHTHRPMIADLRDGSVNWRESRQSEDLRGSVKAVVNPGAVMGTHRWLRLDIDAQLATWNSA